MKNIPVALGFASITLSQLALGICMTTLAAMKGGRLILYQETRFYLKYLRTSFFSGLCSPTASGNTPRCIPLVCVSPT